MTEPTPTFLPLFPGQVLPLVPPLEQADASAKASDKKQGRSRARDDQGQFAGDDPATPEVNEAFLPDEPGNPET